MNISDRIKSLRASVGITQEELAIKINVSRGNVGDWERGRAKPAADALLALSNYFQVSIDWILTGHSFHSNESEQKKISLDTLNISEDEAILLTKIKLLPEKERWKIEGYIDAILGDTKKNNQKSYTLTNGSTEEAATKEREGA